MECLKIESNLTFLEVSSLSLAPSHKKDSDQLCYSKIHLVQIPLEQKVGCWWFPRFVFHICWTQFSQQNFVLVKIGTLQVTAYLSLCHGSLNCSKNSLTESCTTASNKVQWQIIISLSSKIIISLTLKSSKWNYFTNH